MKIRRKHSVTLSVGNVQPAEEYMLSVFLSWLENFRWGCLKCAVQYFVSIPIMLAGCFLMNSL